jgi:hypothetical protein
MIFRPEIEGSAMLLHQASRRPGVSLAGLIVVVAVILIALGLLLPIIARIRMAARGTESMNNLKQLGLATHNYIDTFRKLPPAVGSPSGQEDQICTAHFCLLPFLEQDALFQKAGGFKGTPWQEEVAATPVKVFVDPQDPSVPPQFVYKGWLATTSYPCNWMVFREGNQAFPASIPDGTANTLMFAQRYQLCNGSPTAWGYAGLYYWAPTFAYYNTDRFQSAPSADDCDPTRPQAIGGRSILTAFCDGSARAIGPQIRSVMWYYICDPADGNAIDLDF